MASHCGPSFGCVPLVRASKQHLYGSGICVKKNWIAVDGIRQKCSERAALNAENLLSQIHDPQRPELADLAKNPLLLNLLATYHRSDTGVQLPRQRAELYQDICTLQLRKRPDARNINLPLSASDRQAVLQTVALRMMQQKS